MRFLKQHLLSPGCLKCGSFLTGASLFCGFCFAAEILPRIDAPKSSPFRHVYLLDWVKGESDVLSEMAYRMKAGNSRLAWAFYARLLAWGLKAFPAGESALVPLASASRASVHAHVLAHELSALTGYPVLNLLEKTPSGKPQKQRSARERSFSAEVHARLQVPEQFTNLIFVDDILTTGQSFLQSKAALKAPEDSVIVTLFYRKKSF